LSHHIHTWHQEYHKGYVGNIIEAVGDDGNSLMTGIGYEMNIPRMRNAVEGIPFVLRRKYHVDTIPMNKAGGTKLYL